MKTYCLLLRERRGPRIPWPLGRGWSEPSLAVLYSLKLYQSSFFCKMSFFDTISTGGSSYLWLVSCQSSRIIRFLIVIIEYIRHFNADATLGCDMRWNCAVLVMAMVRLPSTSYWSLSIDTRYSTINELKRIASYIPQYLHREWLQNSCSGTCR